MKRFLLLLPALSLLLMPMPASANYGYINSAVDSVGTPLPGVAFSPDTAICDATGGACSFVFVALAVVNRFRPALVIIAMIVLVILGIRMLVGQEDDRIEKTRTAMTGLVSGIVLAYLIEPFVRAFYGTDGDIFRGDINQGAAIVRFELGGIIEWALGIMATLAVLMIVLTAFKSIMSAGSEESVTSIRKTLLSVGAGLLLLTFRVIVANTFATSISSPVPFLGTLVTIIDVLMTFLGLAALLVFIYAGLQLVLSLGKEESMQKAKGLFGRAAIGFVLILVSLTLVHFVIAPAVGT